MMNDLCHSFQLNSQGKILWNKGTELIEIGSDFEQLGFVAYNVYSIRKEDHAVYKWSYGKPGVW